jgi:predicted DNA-binding transcriptional regulator AlpA
VSDRPSAVPSLDAIAADPSLVETLPRETQAEIALRLSRAAMDIMFIVLATAPTPSRRPEDRLLDVKEAAAKLGRTPAWLYAHWRELPFSVTEPGQRPRFSERAIDAWIQARLASGPRPLALTDRPEVRSRRAAAVTVARRGA